MAALLSMNEMNPLVSIVVRTKDRPSLLRRALSSIALQTYRPLEVVLVNDGGCPLDIEDLKGLLGNISLNYIPLAQNMGRAHAGNVGIKYATGTYIGFLDDDDAYFPSAIETLVRSSVNQADSVMYGKVVCRAYMDEKLLTVIDEKLIGEPFNAGKIVLENFIPINAVCIPRSLFDKMGLLDTDLIIYEDWDMMIRISEISSFHFIDTTIAEYSIIGSATISGKGGPAMQSTYREKVLSKHIGKLNAHDLLSYLQHIIDQVVLEKDEKNRGSLKMLEESIEQLECKIEDIQSSYSWRLTKPFRLAHSAYKRLLNG